MGAGFALALTALGALREVLGNGSLFGLALFGDSFQPWVIMILPPGGFLMLGMMLLVFAWVKELRTKAADRLTREAA
jgi:electron transport complex protein RnfE